MGRRFSVGQNISALARSLTLSERFFQNYLISVPLSDFIEYPFRLRLSASDHMAESTASAGTCPFSDEDFREILRLERCNTAEDGWLLKRSDPGCTVWRKKSPDQNIHLLKVRTEFSALHLCGIVVTVPLRALRVGFHPVICFKNCLSRPFILLTRRHLPTQNIRTNRMKTEGNFIAKNDQKVEQRHEQ